MSETPDRVTDAVLAVPGVVGSSVGEVGTDGADPVTDVHVAIDADAPLWATAHRVQQVAHDVAGGRVDVTVEELR